jgi:hypothetical protein
MVELSAGQVLIQNDVTGRQTVVSEAVYRKSIEGKISPFHGWSIVPQVEAASDEEKPVRKTKK